jgi:ribosomal protein L14E/L6E/L27E
MKETTPAEGIICESLQGRDKGNLYCVVRVLSEGLIEVADGVSKKFSRPKKKNLKHIRLYPKKVTDYSKVNFGGKGVDCELAFALKCFKAEQGTSRTK